MRFLDWFRWSKGGSDAARKHFEEGLRLGRQGKWQEAISKFSGALDSCPSFVEARIARANAYFLLEEWNDAIADFSEFLSTNPRSVEALVGRASTYAAKAADIAVRYQKAGGKQYCHTFEELNMPMNELLRSVAPDKAMWIRTTNTLMELQFAARKDVEEVIKIDPNNRMAKELMRDLSGL